MAETVPPVVGRAGTVVGRAGAVVAVEETVVVGAEVGVVVVAVAEEAMAGTEFPVGARMPRSQHLVRERRGREVGNRRRKLALRHGPFVLQHNAAMAELREELVSPR